MKRDDQSGLAAGGNKVRKLEYLLGAAAAQGCDCVVTAGAAQSNHCRQTAAAAARLGWPCHLLLGGEAPGRPEGNLLLDHLLGAKIHHMGPRRQGEDLPALADRLRAQGRRPAVLPYGGSNALGAAGFVHAMLELAGQCRTAGFAPGAVVFASSSGGTHAGLIAGGAAAGWHPRLLGIAIDKDLAGEGSLAERVIHLAEATASLLGLPGSRSAEVELHTARAAAGYGVVGAAEHEAMALLARTEGILLDPVYTARAFAGLLDLLRDGRLQRARNVVFWHTGGLPALFCQELFPLPPEVRAED